MANTKSVSFTQPSGMEMLMPDLYAKQLQLERQQQYADSLRQQSMDPLKTDQMAGGFIVPVSPVQGLAKLAEAYMARKSQGDIDIGKMDLAKQQGVQMNNAIDRDFGGTGQPVQGAPPPPTMASGPSMGGDSLVAGLPGVNGQSPPQQAPQSGYEGPGGLNTADAKKLLRWGNTPLGAVLAKQMEGNAPTEQWRNALAAANGDKELAMKYMRSQFNKPMDIAPGGTVYDPDTRQPLYTAPYQMTPDQQVNNALAAANLGINTSRLGLERQNSDRAAYDSYYKTGQMPPGMTPPGGAPAQPPAGVAGAPTGAPVPAPMPRPTLPPEKQAELNLDREKMKPKAYAAVQTFDTNAERTMQMIDEALPHVSKWTSGSGSMLKGIPATDAKDFAAKLDSIKANIGFQALAEMRANSPTGGALGNVSDPETRFLQATLGSLDQAQSPNALKESLGKVREALDRARKRTRAAYEQDYGQGQQVTGVRKYNPATGTIE